MGADNPGSTIEYICYPGLNYPQLILKKSVWFNDSIQDTIAKGAGGVALIIVDFMLNNE